MSGTQGSIKRDGSRGAEEPRRQLRRTASRTKQREGGANDSTTVVVKPRGGRQDRAEESQQDHAQGHPQVASDDARPILDGVGHSADQSVEPRSGQHAEADADTRGKGAARGTRAQTRPTLRLGLLGPAQVSPAEVHSGLLGPTGTALTNINMRRCAILLAGQNVRSRHQDNHAERHVTHRNDSSFSKHSVKPRQSACTDGLGPQPWNESSRPFWKIF